MLRSLARYIYVGRRSIALLSLRLVQTITHKKLLQIYKKDEGGAFKSRAYKQNAHNCADYAVKKQRRKRISKINVNVLAPKGNLDV